MNPQDRVAWAVDRAGDLLDRVVLDLASRFGTETLGVIVVDPFFVCLGTETACAKLSLLSLS